MRSFIGLLLFYSLINVLLIALGIGIGLLLHWILVSFYIENLLIVS